MLASLSVGMRLNCRVDPHAHDGLVDVLIERDRFDAADRDTGHRDRRARLEAADVLELRLHLVTVAVDGKFAVGDLRHQEEQRTRSRAARTVRSKFPQCESNA